jgi:two-component system, CitB family, sensor kinase
VNNGNLIVNTLKIDCMGSDVMYGESIKDYFIKYNFIFALIIILIMLVFGFINLSEAVKNELGKRALSSAQLVAEHPVVIEGLKKSEPTPELQQFTTDIKEQIGAEYVVLGDENGIRYTHPDVNKIGKKMVGNDNYRALVKGESYVSIAEGSLGKALRGKAPVKDENGDIIGVVSVGFLYDQIYEMNLNYFKYLAIGLILIFFVVILVSTFLATGIKKELLDYEPSEISLLLKEKNAILESIHEGIIILDSNKCITYVNKRALEILNLDSTIVNKNIMEVFEDRNIDHMISSGKPELNRSIRYKEEKIIFNSVPYRNNEELEGVIISFKLFDDVDLIARELSQVKTYIESLRAQTHEFNNFLYTLSGLIELEEYEEVQRLINKERIGNNTLLAFITKHIKDSFLIGLIIGFYNRAKELKVNLILDEDSYCGKLTTISDKHIIISILGNLVINAFEAVEHLDVENRVVRIYIRELKNELIFEVEDSGDGIDYSMLNTYTQKRISTKNPENRGYGLSIVLESIEKLNGNITLEKGDLGGALFYICIPKGV